MKSVITILSLVTILFTVQVSAQQTTAKGSNSVLWRVSGKGLIKPSYLFGAIDYVCTDKYVFSKTMQDCFAKSDKVCFSLNYGDTALKGQLRDALTDKHKHLKDYFTPADYAAVKTYVQAKWHLNLDLPKVQSYKLLSLQPFVVKELIGCSKVVSYEIHLMGEAKRANKTVVGIETVQEFIHKMNAAHFDEKVAQTLTDMAKGSTYYNEYRSRLEQAYHDQNIQKMNSLFKNSAKFSSADQNVFLDEANKQMTTRMPTFMKQSSVFFVVNPINMWGDEGIIKMLRKEGYTVEALY